MGDDGNENNVVVVDNKVIVVGMNRPRLNKIMSMVDDEVHHHNNGNEQFQGVDFIPCLVAMSSYEGEDGQNIRYMSNFVYRDGSPMSTFFDDEAFRESLGSVVMVGYEWEKNDEQLVEKYFQANLLSVTIHCVSPNEEFASLSEEMSHFKNLTDEEKEQHSSNQTMGPKKMKRFILDTAKALPSFNRHKKEIETEKAATCPDGDGDAAEADADAESPPEEVKTEEEKKRIPGFIDHNLTTFACRMCRTVLFGENNLMEDHKKALHSFKRRSHHSSGGGAGACQSLFCDESVLEWLAPDGADVEGRLTCSHCNHKVGHWNWSGAQCSCGTWVVPAIQIPHGKIDVILPPSERIRASPLIVAPKAF